MFLDHLHVYIRIHVCTYEQLNVHAIQWVLFHFTDIDIINTTATTLIGVVNTTSSIQFGCQASGVPMVTNIRWTHPSHITLAEQLQFSMDNSSVTATGDVVGRIDFNHTGKYRCTATNGVTANSIVFRLVVKGKNYMYS